MINRIIALSIGFIVGIVAATVQDVNSAYLPWICYPLAGAGLAHSLWTIRRERRWMETSKAMILVPPLIAGLALGMIRGNSVIHANTPAVKFFNGLRKDEIFDMKGAIVAEPEQRGPRALLLRLRLSALKKASDSAWTEVSGDDVRVTISKPRSKSKAAIFANLSDSRSFGNVITARASWTPIPESSSPGAFNMKAFLLAEGCVADIKLYNWRKRGELRGAVTDIEPHKGFFLMEWALAAKRDFMTTYCNTIPSPESRLVAGATLGARFALRGHKYHGTLIEDIFRSAGVGHVLAVSGLHVSVVSLLLFSLFGLSRMPPKYFAPILILLLFLFTLLTGARPSSLRATIMNAVIILTFVYAGAGFKRATYAGLAISALFILFRRPMVLYSAGFLLSFGAVLSLILISPPAERLLRQLRGAGFAFTLAWYAGVVAFASLRWNVFLNWDVIALLIILLAGLLTAGARLNSRFPALLAFRFDRLPGVMRMFLAAQLAIQIGMMIPMSAFFFGNFPIAGMFVNLIAIPLVGILVQLGILIGVVGAIPLIGKSLALVFGAANYLVASIFIFTAWLGNITFPYPPTPKPSVTWMVCYYAILAAILLSQLWIPKARTMIYAISAKKPKLVPALMVSTAIIAGGCATFNILKPPAPAKPVLDIVQGTSTPVVVVTGIPNGALIINSGSSFLASRNVKNLLLARGEITVSTAVATGRSPSDGAEGFAKLAEKLPIKRVVFPAFAGSPDGSFAIPEDSSKAYEAYFKAIGMKKKVYKSRKAKYARKRKYKSKRKPSKNRWVLKCLKAYKSLIASPAGKNIEYQKYPTTLKITNCVSCEIITPAKGTYPASVMLTVGEKRYLVVGDPANCGLAKLAPEQLACDQLILGAPTSMKATYYFKGLKTLLAKIAPKKIVLCVDSSRMSESRKKAVEKCEKACAKFNFTRTDNK